MLEKSGDLIPVKYEAVYIPWTKRKSQVLNFLHRGLVNFQTHVYDTNVGDISPLCVYFNPERWTVEDLNNKFGIQPQNSEPHPEKAEVNIEITHPKTGEKLEVRSLCPRLLIYPERHSPAPGPAPSMPTPSIHVNPPSTASNDEQIKELLRYYEDPGAYGGQDRGRLYSRGSSKSPEVGGGRSQQTLGAESRANASHGSQGLSTSNSASSLLGQSRTSPSSSLSPCKRSSPIGDFASHLINDSSNSGSRMITPSLSPAFNEIAANEDDGSNGAFLAVDPLEDNSNSGFSSYSASSAATKPASAGPGTAGISFASALASMADQLSSSAFKSNSGSETNLFDRLSEKRMEDQVKFRDRSASTSGIVSSRPTSASRFSGISSSVAPPGGIFGFGATSTWAPPNFSSYADIDANWQPKFIDFDVKESKDDEKMEATVSGNFKENYSMEETQSNGMFMQETLV